jgi:uncharacterized protein (UPF0276 family)
MQPINPVSHLGFGLGLRAPHYPHIFEHQPEVDWFEIISENFMDTDGRPKRNLARIKEHYPIVMHGVALSIGTVDPLNSDYLQKLKALARWVNPVWISDHLCWTGVAHSNTHDLLPVPYTEEALKHVVARIRQVQDYLERPIALENPSTYLEFKSSHMPEAEFIACMVEKSGCNLLLDINNVYVTCYNHRLDPRAYIDMLPLDRVAQIHLSGHSNYGTHIIDTHDDHVVDEVWALYGYVVKKVGRVLNTMIEWDDKIPGFPVLFAELEKARRVAKDAEHHPALPELTQAPVPYEMHARISTVSLESEQQLMQDAIMLGAKFDSDPAAWIRAKNKFLPADQLAIYTNAYRYRLCDSTAEDYPVLKTYLGDNQFDRLIRDFIETVRSDHFNIGRFGAKLPDFVATQTSLDTFARELCILETAIAQLTDPQETEALTPEHLANMTPETLLESVLHPREALQLFTFKWSVNDYYRSVNEDHPMTTPPEQRPTYLAVFRHEDTVWRMELAEQEYALLERLFAGMPVGAALEEDSSAATEQLSLWFARWIRNGLLAYRP